MKLYCATGNPGKLREFQEAAAGRVELAPLPDFASIPACLENGLTFEENAIQKAVYYGRHTADLLFAEDSGLQVDALGRAPGIHSARFSGPGATDESNNRLLLERLAGIGNRTARYVCVIALVERGALLGTFRGAVEGEILEEPRGSGGFGYDPLFYYHAFGCTFAEVTAGRKFAVSHRGQAFRALLAWVEGRSNT
jgi:XTP/dITP diphosphohydrolase